MAFRSIAEIILGRGIRKTEHDAVLADCSPGHVP
jgi:hypothetical protein